MQQLERRDTHTPTDIPHVRGNCGLILNREETLSVSGLKTLSNISDAAITATEQAGQNLRVSAVYVLNMRGYFDLRCLDGTKIHASANANGIKLLQSASTFLIDILVRGTLLPGMNSGVSATPAPNGET